MIGRVGKDMWRIVDVENMACFPGVAGKHEARGKTRGKHDVRY
jgi:hypothetical protein